MMLDSDARPGSVASLLRTFIGVFVRYLGGWVSTAHLVELLGEAGVPGANLRTALTRVKQQGLLEAEPRYIDGARTAGYRLGEGAEAMLRRGDARIFSERRVPAGGSWCIVSFTVAESRRQVRHRLRRHLHLMGAGTIASGLWILAGHLTDEVRALLDHLEVEATLIHTKHIEPFDSAHWWDLESLHDTHIEFIAHARQLQHTPSAFVRYLHLVDRWRVIPSIDPGLPLSLLPANWPGETSFALFRAGVAADAEAARTHVHTVTGTPLPETVARGIH